MKEILKISKKEENNNIEENGNEIKDEKNEGEEDNDLYKITNIEYEKFIMMHLYLH